MTPAPDIDTDASREILSTVGRHQWSWTVRDLPALAEQLRWSIVSHTKPGATVTTSWPLGDPEVDMIFSDELVDYMTFYLACCGDPGEATPEQIAAGDNAFAVLARTGQEVLGEPASRKLGETPSLRWRNETATTELANLAGVVSLRWARNAFQDEWDHVDDGWPDNEDGEA